MLRKTRKITYNLGIIALLLCGILYVCSRFVHLGNVEYTDNAFVKQHITPVNARVEGYIRNIMFDEFQRVHKGDTLVVLEDADLKLKLIQAEADLKNAEAAYAASGVNVATTENNLKVSDADIEEAWYNMMNAKKEESRYRNLLSEGAVTRQEYDNKNTIYLTANAHYEKLIHAKSTTRMTKNQQMLHSEQALYGIKVAQANVALARLNLSYATIIAPCDGVMGRKNIKEGELIQPGMNLVDIVDNTDCWVIANYKESQLHNIKVGSKVSITADAVPDRVYVGSVESISDATGAAFSMMPQENATGNFVKVEQRIPVRISLQGNEISSLSLLRAGLNVECEIKY